MLSPAAAAAPPRHAPAAARRGRWDDVELRGAGREREEGAAEEAGKVGEGEKRMGGGGEREVEGAQAAEDSAAVG